MHARAVPLRPRPVSAWPSGRRFSCHHRPSDRPQVNRSIMSPGPRQLRASLSPIWPATALVPEPAGNLAIGAPATRLMCPDMHDGWGEPTVLYVLARMMRGRTGTVRYKTWEYNRPACPEHAGNKQPTTQPRPASPHTHTEEAIVIGRPFRRRMRTTCPLCAAGRMCRRRGSTYAARSIVVGWRRPAGGMHVQCAGHVSGPGTADVSASLIRDDTQYVRTYPTRVRNSK